MGRIHPVHCPCMKISASSKPRVQLARAGLTGCMTQALSSQWPVMPGGNESHLLLLFRFSLYFPSHLYSSALMRAGFPLLSPAEAVQPARRKLCLALRLRASGRGCLRRACWLLIASEKAASGGSLRPQCCNPAFKAPLCVLWGLFTWVGAARERLRSPRVLSCF